MFLLITLISATSGNVWYWACIILRSDSIWHILFSLLSLLCGIKERVWSLWKINNQSLIRSAQRRRANWGFALTAAWGMNQPVVFNPGPGATLPCMFEMFPSSNTPDSNDQPVIKLCRSLITSRSLESKETSQTRRTSVKQEMRL